MKKGYLGLWLILVLSFSVFIAASSFGTINIGGMEFKTSGIYDRLTQKKEVKVDIKGEAKAKATEEDTFKPQPVEV